MHHPLKSTVEGLFGSRYWFDRSTNRKNLVDLLAKLSPIGTVAPLIRIGANGDGGYLLPDDLKGCRTCVSPGVSDEIGFDQEMAGRDFEVLMADASVAAPPVQRPEFRFIRKHLDVFDSEYTIRLQSLMSLASGLDDDLILQMDIEGAEWRVLMDTPTGELARYRIMVIEFHNMHQLFGRTAFAHQSAVFNKLLHTHSVVHIHPNNFFSPTHFHGLKISPTMEFTFYRNDRAFDRTRKLVFPNPLDADCVSDKPSVSLSPEWHTPR